MDALKVTVLRGAAELACALPAWEALAANALEPNPVYEPWMLVPALEAFAAGSDLRIATVRHGSELVGLFPLACGHRYRGLPLRALSSWTHPHFKLGVPLVCAAYAHEVLKALFAWARGTASVIDLAYIPTEGAFNQALTGVLNEEDRVSFATDAYARPILRRAADAETYAKTCIPGDVRRELKRREKRLADLGKLEHRVLRTRDELPRWIEEFLALEASGWKGRRGSALACTEPNRRFAVELFTGAFERGRLLMSGLDLDGRPIARYSGLLAGEGAITFKTAFDESLRKFGPGTLALLDLTALFHQQSTAQWMDSYTAPGNEMMGALWKHRRTVQRIAVATSFAGEAALAALPLLRFAGRCAAKLRRSVAPARTIPSLRPA